MDLSYTYSEPRAAQKRYRSTPCVSSPRLSVCGWEGLQRHPGAGEAAVPAISFLRDGDRLDGAEQGTTPADGDPSDFGENQAAVIKRGSIAELFVGEAVVAVASLEARIARLLALLDAAK